MTGKRPSDYKLQLDDVIFIPGRLKTVSIFGEINRPGIYELKSDESLEDLIEMAGKLKVTAYIERAQIDRIVPFEERSKLGMDRMINDVNLDFNLNSEEIYPLKDGDRINVFSVLSMRQNIVTLGGAVTRQGRYDLSGTLRLSRAN